MAVAVVVVAAGEVAVAVEEVAADVVAVGPFSLQGIERILIRISGWTGGNGDPVRNSRW